MYIFVTIFFKCICRVYVSYLDETNMDLEQEHDDFLVCLQHIGCGGVQICSGVLYTIDVYSLI